MLKKDRARLSTLFFLASCAATASRGRADVTNGNFTSGNTGFTSGYGYAASSDPGGGHYTVGTNPKTWNSSLSSFGDHTTGTGEMLIADGSATAHTQVWSESVTVTADTQYTLTFYSASCGNDNNNGIDPSPATLVVTANGTQFGSTLDVSATNGSWSQFTATFDSGTLTTEPLAITDSNLDGGAGNDFAIDDISLTVPSALAWDGSASNSWDVSSLNWTNGTAAYSAGRAVTFGDFAANGTTAVQHTNPISIVSGGVAPSSVTFSNSTAYTYRFTDADSTNGITGAASVTINGGGTVIFSAPNSYSGGTNITNGTLKAASGSLLSTGTVSIGASGKLFVGDGSSAAPGTLATGNQTWTGGGTYAPKLNGSSGPTGTADLLNIGGGTGTLTLSGAAQATPFTVSLQTGNVALGSTPSGTTWQIATFGSLSGYTGPAATPAGVNPGSQFALNTSAFGSSNPGFSLDLLEIDGSHDALELLYVPTPEPATAVLGLCALGPMLMSRRRRARRQLAEHL